MLHFDPVQNLTSPLLGSTSSPNPSTFSRYLGNPRDKNVRSVGEVPNTCNVHEKQKPTTNLHVLWPTTQNRCCKSHLSDHPEAHVFQLLKRKKM